MLTGGMQVLHGLLNGLTINSQFKTVEGDHCRVREHQLDFNSLLHFCDMLLKFSMTLAFSI